MGPGGGGNVFKWCCINSTASSAAKETCDSEEKEDSDPCMDNMKICWPFRGYKNFLRINNELFEELVHCVGPHIKKITTPWRQPLSVGLRLAITLRYMASGDSYMFLQYSFWEANNTISCSVKETTMAIV